MFSLELSCTLVEQIKPPSIKKENTMTNPKKVTKLVNEKLQNSKYSSSKKLKKKFLSCF